MAFYFRSPCETPHRGQKSQYAQFRPCRCVWVLDSHIASVRGCLFSFFFYLILSYNSDFAAFCTHMCTPHTRHTSPLLLSSFSQACAAHSGTWAMPMPHGHACAMGMAAAALSPTSRDSRALSCSLVRLRAATCAFTPLCRILLQCQNGQNH